MATFKQRESGWWQAVVRRKGHPQQSKSFEKKTDAIQWARDVENKIDRGVFIDQREAEKTTLHEALGRYLREVTAKKRGATVEEYRVKAWQLHKLAACSLAALRSVDFASYRDERLRAGCAAATVQRELMLISHLYRIARREWGFEGLQNPLEAVSKPVANNARDRAFLPGEEARVLSACAPRLRGEDGRFGGGASNQWLQPVVAFALETAMRQGEIAALAWENVSLETRVAYLPMTKNGEARSVPLSSAAVTILEAAKGAALPKGEKSVVALPRGPVFKSTANAIKIGFSRAVARARKAYEKECEAKRIAPDSRMLMDLHFHDLRHVATTRLANKLPNVIELAAVTGHKDLRMLKRYYHPRAEELARKLG